jgi:hypothetical protein
MDANKDSNIELRRGNDLQDSEKENKFLNNLTLTSHLDIYNTISNEARVKTISPP